MLIKFISFVLLFHSLSALANPDYLTNNSLERHALVIGNNNYENLPELDNSINDAEDISNALSALGFAVDVQFNASQEAMDDAIIRFGRRITSGGVGLFYYAGHAVQVDGISYMIPVDANIKKQKHFKYRAVNVGQLFDEMAEANNGANIIILDACRDNPLKQFSSAGRGLIKVNPPTGTLLSFATAPDSVASDGKGKNGTYTKHLLKYLKTPGLSIGQVFEKVTHGVRQETNDAQVPWVNSSFPGNFYFIAPDADATTIQSQAPITINYGSTHNTQILWISVAAFLFITSLGGFYFYKLKFQPSKINNYSGTKKKQTSNPVQKRPVPDLNSLEDEQAVGYLIELKSNKAIAAVKPGKTLVLGRSKSRTDVYLSDTAISAEHAALHYHSGSHCFILEDLDSSNGTWIKGQPPLSEGIKTAVSTDEIFYLADKSNAFYIFVAES